MILKIVSRFKTDAHKITCDKNQTIGLNRYKYIIKDLKPSNDSQLHIKGCRMTLPLVEVINALEAKGQVITYIELEEVDALQAKHFSGVNESHVEYLYLNNVAAKHNVLSTISKLKNLTIDVDKAEDIPDLSRVKVFEAMRIRIYFNGVGNKTRKPSL